MLVWCFIRNRKIEHNKISRQFGRNTLFHFLWKAMWAKYCDPCQSLTFDKVDNGIIKRRFPPPPAPALANSRNPNLESSADEVLPCNIMQIILERKFSGKCRFNHGQQSYCITDKFECSFENIEYIIATI